MTPDSFKETIHKLDFTTADVAILMGVTRRTAQLWLAGTSPVPQSVAILLDAILEGLVTIEWLDDKIVFAMKVQVA